MNVQVNVKLTMPKSDDLITLESVRSNETFKDVTTGSNLLIAQTGKQELLLV